MSLLAELKTIMDTQQIAAETGVFTTTPAPATYVVFVPMEDTFECADDQPDNEVQAVRVSLFTKSNYLSTAIAITRAIISAGLTVSARRYIGHEDDTGYHHYVIEVEQTYKWEE